MSTLDLTGVNSVAFDVYASRTGSNLKFGLHNEGVNQSQLNANTYTTVGDTGDTEWRLAQGFQFSSISIVSAVEIKQDSHVGTPTGDWTLRIETDDSGLPSGTLVDVSASIVVTPPGDGNVVKGTFATPFSLSASTPYWLVIECDNQSASNAWYVSINTSTNDYAGGNAAYKTAAWHAYPNYDLYFKVYRIVTTETTPNITSANTWQTVTWDLSGVDDADKNNIDQFIITVVNADAENTFYVDNFRTVTTEIKSIMNITKANVSTVMNVNIANIKTLSKLA